MCRVPTKEADRPNAVSGQYRYKVKYITDPTALPLSDSSNYQVSYKRHLSLRNTFSKLEKPPKRSSPKDSPKVTAK